MAVWILGFLFPAVLVASQYNESRAIEYAKLAGAAYCPSESLRQWNCGQCSAKVDVSSVRVCSSTWDNTQAFVAKWDGKCLVSVEGTQKWASMMTDLEIYFAAPSKFSDDCYNCTVHAGYLQTWNGLRPCIVDMLAEIGCGTNDGMKLAVTGHSLGAGVSAIAMMDLTKSGWEVAESYNFGMPRTGDSAFAVAFSLAFRGKFWRVTHHKDPIVQVPPDVWPGVGNLSFKYEHVEEEVFYDGNISEGYKICVAAGNLSCAEQYWNPIYWDLSFGDHLHYLDVPLGHAGCDVSDTVHV